MQMSLDGTWRVERAGPVRLSLWQGSGDGIRWVWVWVCRAARLLLPSDMLVKLVKLVGAMTAGGSVVEIR